MVHIIFEKNKENHAYIFFFHRFKPTNGSK